MRREGKLGEHLTSHTRHTGKCKRPRCKRCHTAPLNKSMGKSKGEWKLKQSDINSNYLMHDWRLCETSTSLPVSAGRNRPKIKVGSPSSVWTSAWNYYEDSLDPSDDYDGDADSGATVCGGSTFGPPPKTLAVLIPTRTIRRASGAGKKTAASLPYSAAVQGGKTSLHEALGALGDEHLKPRAGPSCVSDSETLSESLCFGTIGAVGDYWKSNLSAPGCFTLANHWPLANNPAGQVSPTRDNFSSSSDIDIVEDSELLFLDDIQSPSGGDSEDDCKEISNRCGLAAVMVDIGSHHTPLKCQDDWDFEKAEVDLERVDSDSDESWSDVVDAADSASEDWCFMDVEEGHTGDFTFRGVAE